MQTDFCVIDFSENGEVSAMNRDEFSLGFLGKQSIARASEIMFNEAQQLWEILLIADNPTAMIPAAAQGFVSYDRARKVEVAWLELARLHDVAPMSPQGLTLLKDARS